MRHQNFCTPKRVSTPKGVKMCPIWHFFVFQVELPSNNEHRPNLKPNRWKLLDLGPTALSGTQNLPHSHRPMLGDRNGNLGPYHLLDIITQIRNLAKFQIKRTTASKVMRPRNFCAPKKGQYPKVAQICPKWNFGIFQVEIPSNNEYRPNLKPNGWKLLNLWPIALSGTQNCPIRIAPFMGKNRNLGPSQLLDIITKEKVCQISHQTYSRFQSYETSCNFWVPKRVNTPKEPKSGPFEIFLFLRWRYPQNNEHKPNLKWNRFKFLNLGPTEQSVPKLPHFPNPDFGTEIGNSDDASLEICYI